MKKAGSFGARPCKRARELILQFGRAALPRSWRRNWMVARILATPPWADFAAIRLIYKEARRLTEETGIPHVVDHEIPLQHPIVCGLHVEGNLRVLTYAQNDAKRNKWNPDQQELDFDADQSARDSGLPPI